ncbi:MAG: deoxyribonuclease IV [Candidatus Heimdallarchaeota archaeon]|nr:deoxyribonuclease IV [Candidatus Heimdallarchaeota archaeon]
MNYEVKIGCHVSIAKSVDLAFDRAKDIGCATFQIFTKNPRGWAFKGLSSEEIERFRDKNLKYNMSPIVAHISYLSNLASLDKEIYQKSIESFLREIEICFLLGIPYFVVHSGSYKGGSFQEGFERYVSSIQRGIDAGKHKITILVENSASGEKALTGTFSNIKNILEEINDQNVQVCFDTCHAFVAGYDISSKKGIVDFVTEVESTIGLRSISIIHANDSKTDVGSHRDLHEHLGLGKIGEIAFTELINNESLKKKPWILETPLDSIRNDFENINYLRSLIK